MAKTREWIIGADPACDVVVDEAAVSSRHCRLTRNADGYTLEDLQSTNGTFINGVRVSGVKPVTRNDKVTLGRNTPMPWPAAKSTTITIGRLPENDIVLDDPMVSGRHAEITIRGDQATIRDLNSTNGTAVGSADKKTQSSPISSDDTVYFGTSAYRAALLLNPGGAVEPVEATQPVSALPAGIVDGIGGAATARKPKRDWQLPAAIGGAALVVIAVITAIVANSGNGTSTDDPPADENTQKPAAAATAVDPNEALYSVLVKDAQEAKTFRVGTAVAIGERRLLTSGQIIKAIAKLRDEFPVVTVFCPRTEKQFRVDFAKARLHPQFEGAYTAAESANQKYEAAAEHMERLFVEFQSLERSKNKTAANAAKKTSTKKLEDLKRRMQSVQTELEKWDSQVLGHSERATCFDLGVLEVSEPLPVRLEVVGKNADFQSGDAVALKGNPFPAEEPLMASYAGNRSRKVAGRVRMRKRLDSQAAEPYRLIVKSETPLGGNMWTGAAVLDGDGRVVGVVARLTPSYTDKPPPGHLIDVPLASRLRDFLTIETSPTKNGE